MNVAHVDLHDHELERPAGEPLAVIHTDGVGQRGHTATALLAGLDRRAANLDGGYRTWPAATTDEQAGPASGLPVSARSDARSS